MGSTLSTLDHTIGTLLCGTWTSSILFGLVAALYYNYWSTFRMRDPLYVRVLVSFQMFLDTFGQVGQYFMLYQYAITHYGDPTFLTVQNWTYAVYLVTTQTCGLMSQLYLILRIYKLSKSWLISGFFVACSLLSWTAMLLTMIFLESVFKALDQRGGLIKYVNLWLCTSAGTDLLIAGTLVVLLRRMRSEMADTQSFIKKLTIAAIQTGAVTSIVALIVVITFLTNQLSNLDVGFAFSLGRLYSLTLLTNLLVRKQMQSNYATSNNAWQPASSSGPKTFKPARSGNDGIYVATISRVDVDAEKQSERDAENSINMVDFNSAADNKHPAPHWGSM